MAARDLLRTVLRDDLPDLFFGSRCVGCDRPGRALCPGCAPALAGRPYRTAPEPAPPGLPVVWTAARYADVPRAALLAHKERGRVTLAGPLGDALASALAAALADGSPVGSPHGSTFGSTAVPIAIVPVPSTRARVRQRGYDPLLVLSRRAIRRLRGTGRRLELCRAVRLGRPVADQARLDAAARRDNLAAAFEVRPRRQAVRGRPVVLVDDVVTTGATLLAVSQALRAAGAEVVAAAVVAATPRNE